MMKKLILPTIFLFVLSLVLSGSTAYTDTVLLACPQIMRSDTTELVYDAPLTASRLPEMRDWDRESTSLEILYCESPNWVPYTDLMSIGYTLGINRLGVNEETDYADYSEESVLKPFGNGRAYFHGTPYGGSSNPGMTLIDKAGSCEIVFGAGVGPNEAGSDLYVHSKPTAPMLAEHQRNAERMTKEMTEAINKLKADIAANQELAEFCAVNGTPDKPPAITAEDEQKEQFEEPAGKGIGEFIRKIQSLRLNPFDKPQDQIGSTEQKTPGQTVNDWIMENDLILDPARLERMEREKLDLELYGRTPQMTKEIIKKAQKDWEKTFEVAETKPATSFRARADFLKGDADIKYPGTDEWVPLKTGDIIPPGATLFTGMDATLVLSLQDKGVFQMLPFTEIVISEETIKGASHTDVKLSTGDIEVSVEGGVFTGTLQVSTPASTTGTRGTHFWVSYDKDNRLSVTGVYEGKVEVILRGSNKSVTISPNGGKPGVAVVSRKLSPVKVALAGLILAVIAGGIVWFIKRKKKK